MTTVTVPDDLVLSGEPFLRRDAMATGFARGELDALRALGVLRQPLRGVLVDARAPDTLPLRARSVALVLPDGAAVARRTAAWLYGIDCRGPGERDVVLPAECVVPVPAEPLSRAGVRCYQARLPADDVCLVAGVPCTTPARTALDLARFLPRFMGLGALDAMAHAGLVDPADLAARIEEWKGDRFVDQARQLIALCEPRTESFGESWTRLRIVDAGFPRPEPQICLPDDDHEVFRIDMGYRKRRVGFEFDGEEFHSSDEQRRHDEWRRLECERRWGWSVTGFVKGHVLGPSMALELAVGEMLSMTPRISRRAW
ncbi:MAG: type IV toxin-antitoxin system AbiEi family antitoxin [Actinomycetota bacterium]